MRESVVEKKFAAEVKKRGGLAVKFVSPRIQWGARPLGSLPRWKDGLCGIEGSGRNHAALQQYRARQLTALGFHVYTVDRKEMIGGILDEVQTT